AARGEPGRFFFSSRSRHTIFSRDWSSDVCSSDLEVNGITVNGVDMIFWNAEGKIERFKVMIRPLKAVNLVHEAMGKLLAMGKPRSEERRGGKEGSSGWYA